MTQNQQTEAQETTQKYQNHVRPLIRYTRPLLFALTPDSRSNQQLKLFPLYSAHMITPIVNILVGRLAFECLKVYLAWNEL